MANFFTIITLACFLSKCLIAFLYGIEFHGDYLILIFPRRFLGVLMFFVAKGVCTSLLKFLFILAVINPNS